MKLIPCNGNIVVKRIVEEKKKGSLIFLNEDNNQLMYDVVSSSEKEVPLGANVILMNYKGQEVEIQEQKYLIVHKNDVLAIIDK